MLAVYSGYFDLAMSGDVVIVRLKIPAIRHPHQAQEFSDDLVELLDHSKKTLVIVNLGGVHYLGSSAFAVLFNLAKKLDQLGGKLVLCGMDADLCSGATILGLGAIIPNVTTEAEALATISADEGPRFRSNDADCQHI